MSYRPLVPIIRSSGLEPHHILGMREHPGVRLHLLDKAPVATAVRHQTCVYITPLSLQVIQHPPYSNTCERQADNAVCCIDELPDYISAECGFPRTGSLGRSLCCDTRRPHTHRVAVCAQARAALPKSVPQRKQRCEGGETMRLLCQNQLI